MKAVTRCENGFRINSEVYFLDESVPKKCFIYLNKNEWSKIEDVMSHIKRIFSLEEEEVSLFIEDNLLPRNETINLIEKDDTLIIKIVPRVKQKAFQIKSGCLSIEPSSENQVQKKKKKSKAIEANTNFQPETDPEEVLRRCLIELNKKRKEIIEASPGPSTSNNGYLEDVDNENSSLIDADFVPPKKKRKRKHKKRARLEESGNPEEQSMEQSCPMEASEDVGIDENMNANNSSSFRHLHFSETEDDYQINLSKAKIENGECSYDIRSHLTKLASRPKSEKVFSRKNQVAGQEDNGLDNDSTIPNKGNEKSPGINESSPIVEKPKIGDTIVFTKIKIGSNYCPEPSGEIIGKVTAVKWTPDHPEKLVSMEILKGSEEFLMPDGKFSIDFEESENNDDEHVRNLHVTDLSWHEVLQPRLYSFK